MDRSETGTDQSIHEEAALPGESAADIVGGEEYLAEELRSAVKSTDPVKHSHRKRSGRRRHRSRDRKKTEKVRKARGKVPAWVRVTGVLLAIVLVLGVSGTGLVFSKLNKIGRLDGEEPTVDAEGEFDQDNLYGVQKYGADLITSEDVTNILLIGQDRRKGDAARMRSDAMIICSLNRKTGEILLTSLMRDMYLPVPGKGYGMINATYLAGGFELLNETIRKNFGIRIDGNVEVDFERFIGLMTLIGPIELELSEEEADYLEAAGYSVKTGNNILDADQVLAYCRMRKNVGGDWSRTDRQRKVVAKIYQKLRREDLGTIYRFIDEALPLFRTDMTNREMLRLGYRMVSDRMRITESYRLPAEGTYTQEIREDTLHVLIPDIRENCKRIQKYIYGYMEQK